MCSVLVDVAPAEGNGKVHSDVHTILNTSEIFSSALKAHAEGD